MNWSVKMKLSLGLSLSLRVKFTITFAAKILSFLMITKELEKKKLMFLLLVALIVNQVKDQK